MMASIIAHLYADINNPAKKKRLTVQENEDRIVGTFPEVEEMEWNPVHRGGVGLKEKYRCSIHSGGRECRVKWAHIQRKQKD